MLEVVMVRHGQTAANAARRFAGLEDTPLTDIGRAMAAALDTALADESIDAVWSSGLQRARHTVEPLAARHGLALQVDAGLAEYDCGTWTGRTRAEVAELEAEAWRAFDADPAANAPPGGETAAQVGARSLAAFERLRASTPSGRVVLASHKGTLRILLASWLEVPLAEHRRRIDWSLCGMTRVRFDDAAGPLLLSHNSLAHLPPELRSIAEDR